LQLSLFLTLPCFSLSLRRMPAFIFSYGAVKVVSY